MKTLEELKKWWFSPQKCPKHGEEFICHGYDENWDCPSCLEERVNKK